MKRPIRSILILAALSIPASAFAQYRVDNGQARDANNRLGSGGFNSAAQLNGRINGLAGNYVVTGNVTGGRSFRGSLGYTDPTAFRGSLGSATFDNYLRDSIGASQMRGTSGTGYNFATIQPYFGAGSTVAPPAGFGRDPSTGAYYLPNRAAGVTAGDGRVDFGGASRADITAGVLSTQRAIGGAGLANSPFANLNQRDQLTNMVRMSDFTTMSRPGVNDAAFGVTDGVVSGPRLPTADLKSAADESGTSDIGIGSDAAKQEEMPQSPGLTGQGTVFKNLNAIDNNSQYAELRKRLDEKNAQPKLPKLPNSEAVESANKLNEELRRAKEREAESQKKETDGTVAPAAPRPPAGAGNAGAANPVVGDSAPTNPNLPKDTLNLPRPADNVAPAARPAIPLEINSLATGVKDKDLGKLLSDAEAAMKQGKFSTAIEAYDRAEQIASDDPLVFMGRSIAELGGSYYRSAEIHLRQAFAADNSLLLAKFDLRTMLTDDRLNFLQNDLAQIAKKNEKDPGPLMLLAFIYYSTGFPERSERALEMVQERAGGNDPTAALLKDMWFPSEGSTDVAPTPEMNK